MTSEIYEHGGLYKQYDMNGVIEVGTGKLMVHDIFDETPEFMKEADFLFCDPPYNQGALSGYYTKAEKDEKPTYDAFTERLFEVIGEVSPNTVVMEAGNRAFGTLRSLLEGRFEYVRWFTCTYYRKASNVCKIIVASHGEVPEMFDFIEGMDEEDAIAFVCANAQFDCIADPCMGKGLVAYYANKAGRKFVGTELNVKRLAVAVDRVTKNARGKVN